MAVGVPAGARAGTYDVTLTARLANGQSRTGVGRLTVSGGGTAVGGGGKSGPAARLRLTTVLPKEGLRPACRGRRRGIAVLIGANTPGRGAGAALSKGPGNEAGGVRRACG